MKKVKAFKRTDEIEAIEAKLLLVRKQTGLEIIANIAAQTGDYEYINNVDLRLELIQNAVNVIYKIN